MESNEETATQRGRQHDDISRSSIRSSHGRTLLSGGAAVAWPLAARAQQPDRVRRIGVLMASAADDSESQARIAAFLEGLQQLGWADGRNVRIDTRWATTDADDIRRHAAELAALAPDVLVAATGTVAAAPLLQATHTVPIVVVQVIDPVGAGFVVSLARPAATRLDSRFTNTA